MNPEQTDVSPRFIGYTQDLLKSITAAEANIEQLLGQSLPEIQDQIIQELETLAIQAPFQTGPHDQLLRLGIREAVAKLYEGALNPCTLWADPRFASVPELQKVLRRFDPGFQQDLLTETLVEAMNAFCPGAPN